MGKSKRKVTMEKSKPPKEGSPLRRLSVFDRLGPGSSTPNTTQPQQRSSSDQWKEKCRNWLRTGSCQYGNKCKYQHTPLTKATKQRARERAKDKKDKPDPNVHNRGSSKQPDGSERHNRSKSPSPRRQETRRRSRSLSSKGEHEGKIKSQVVVTKKPSTSSGVGDRETEKRRLKRKWHDDSAGSWPAHRTTLDFEEELTLEKKRQELQRELELELQKEKLLQLQRESVIFKKVVSSSSSRSSSTSSSSSSSSDVDADDTSSDSSREQSSWGRSGSRGDSGRKGKAPERVARSSSEDERDQKASYTKDVSKRRKKSTKVTPSKDPILEKDTTGQLLKERDRLQGWSQNKGQKVSQKDGKGKLSVRGRSSSLGRSQSPEDTYHSTASTSNTLNRHPAESPSPSHSHMRPSRGESDSRQKQRREAGEEKNAEREVFKKRANEQANDHREEYKRRGVSSESLSLKEDVRDEHKENPKELLRRGHHSATTSPPKEPKRNKLRSASPSPVRKLEVRQPAMDERSYSHVHKEDREKSRRRSVEKGKDVREAMHQPSCSPPPESFLSHANASPLGDRHFPIPLKRKGGSRGEREREKVSLVSPALPMLPKLSEMSRTTVKGGWRDERLMSPKDKKRGAGKKKMQERRERQTIWRHPSAEAERLMALAMDTKALGPRIGKKDKWKNKRTRLEEMAQRDPKSRRPASPQNVHQLRDSLSQRLLSRNSGQGKMLPDHRGMELDVRRSGGSFCSKVEMHESRDDRDVRYICGRGERGRMLDKEHDWEGKRHLQPPSPQHALISDWDREREREKDRERMDKGHERNWDRHHDRERERERDLERPRGRESAASPSARRGARMSPGRTCHERDIGGHRMYEEHLESYEFGRRDPDRERLLSPPSPLPSCRSPEHGTQRNLIRQENSEPFDADHKIQETVFSHEYEHMDSKREGRGKGKVHHSHVDTEEQDNSISRMEFGRKTEEESRGRKRGRDVHSKDSLPSMKRCRSSPASNLEEPSAKDFHWNQESNGTMRMKSYESKDMTGGSVRDREKFPPDEKVSSTTSQLSEGRGRHRGESEGNRDLHRMPDVKERVSDGSRKDEPHRKRKKVSLSPSGPVNREKRRRTEPPQEEIPTGQPFEDVPKPQISPPHLDTDGNGNQGDVESMENVAGVVTNFSDFSDDMDDILSHGDDQHRESEHEKESSEKVIEERIPSPVVKKRDRSRRSPTNFSNNDVRDKACSGNVKQFSGREERQGRNRNRFKDDGRNVRRRSRDGKDRVDRSTRCFDAGSRSGSLERPPPHGLDAKTSRLSHVACSSYEDLSEKQILSSGSKQEECKEILPQMDGEGRDAHISLTSDGALSGKSQASDNYEYDPISDEELEAILEDSEYPVDGKKTVDQSDTTGGIIDALEIDWTKLMCTRDTKPDPISVDVRRRFLPATVLGRIGVSVSLLGADRWETVKQRCELMLHEEPTTERDLASQGVETVEKPTEEDSVASVEPNGLDSQDVIASDNLSTRPLFKLEHEMAAFHAAARYHKQERESLFNNVGPYRRALCARRDMLVRRQLCQSQGKDVGIGNISSHHIDSGLYRASVQIFKYRHLKSEADGQPAPLVSLT